MTDTTDLHRRYAIRLPDGTLARNIFGLTWIWEDRDAAERAMTQLLGLAERIGVEGYRGEIVHQLCTPWVGENDRADHLVDELCDWLTREIGGQQ